MTPTTRCLVDEDVALLSINRALSRNVIRPQFSMAPAEKSGTAIRSDFSKKMVTDAISQCSIYPIDKVVAISQCSIYPIDKVVLNKVIGFFLIVLQSFFYGFLLISDFQPTARPRDLTLSSIHCLGEKRNLTASLH